MQQQQGAAARSRVCHQRRHSRFPAEARSDQPCVPAVCDIVQHPRCTLVVFILLEPLRICLSDNQPICIGHGLGLSREPLSACAWYCRLSARACSTWSCWYHTPCHTTIASSYSFSPYACVARRYLHQVQAVLGFRQVGQVQARLLRAVRLRHYWTRGYMSKSYLCVGT